MTPKLPPTLQRKLRGYHVAYWCVAAAESICIGALLTALLNPNAAILALGWLAVRYARQPSNRQVADIAAARHPQLAEQLRAAVELAESTDPPAVKGSPELLRRLFEETDRKARPVDFSRLLSLKPVALLMALAVIVNLALAQERQKHRRALLEHEPGAQLSPVATSEPEPEPEPAAARADRLQRLKQLASDLDSAPDAALRRLPPRARSLDSTVAEAEAAEQARSVGDLQAASKLDGATADGLSEFARLARDVPELAQFGEQADALAGEYAAAAQPPASPARLLTRRPEDMTSGEVGGTVAETPRGALPDEPPAGEPWMAGVEKLRDTHVLKLEKYPPSYSDEVERYFELIGSRNRR
jgi:hypothetical protein